jgi:hypothetical protein
MLLSISVNIQGIPKNTVTKAENIQEILKNNYILGMLHLTFVNGHN